MQRDESFRRLRELPGTVDLLVIGGGATGMGIAVDAAARGYSIVLLEQEDFGKGTSSRSTKLVHGGVRYLRQGNLSLVIEALRERGILRRNAPHLVHEMPFVIPVYSWFDGLFYGLGLRIYDLLAGRFGFPRSRRLSKKEALSRIPTLNDARLRGGVLYFDGQFDDARLLIDLAHTANRHGAVLLNYARVTRLIHQSNRVAGVQFLDRESNATHTIAARCVINATGAFADAVRQLDNPDAPRTIAPSQGIHLVLDRSFLPGDSALMVPRTPDGRVMFAIPWLGHTLLGTTDTPVDSVPLEPVAQEQEIAFLLSTASAFLRHAPARSDVLSVFAGIRPLFNKSAGQSTARLARDHVITVSPSKLLTIVGGKWTTYRRMAQQAVDRAAAVGGLEPRPCTTRDLPISGDPRAAETLRQRIAHNPALAAPFHPRLDITPAQVIHAARFEMARKLEDVLARRTRALFLDARAALQIAAPVARLMAAELHLDERWVQQQITDFQQLAGNYLIPGA